ncbi:MAG: hypothetical protein ACI97B_000764, partial [Verrucomicrobiales bacterium]
MIGTQLEIRPDHRKILPEGPLFLPIIGKPFDTA